MRILVSSACMLNFLQGIAKIKDSDDNYFDVTVSNKKLYLHHDGFKQGEIQVEANGNCSTEISGASFTRLIRLLKAIDESPIVLVMNSGSSNLLVDNIYL